MSLKITAFTDGGFSSKKDIGAWALTYEYKTPEGVSIHFEKAEAMKGTAQAMEITALVECIKCLPRVQGECTIFSDSQYGVRSFGEEQWKDGNGWIGSWKKKGLFKAQCHYKLFSEGLHHLEEHLQRGMKISFSWVKGHSGNPGNEYVDSLVRNAMNI